MTGETPRACLMPDLLAPPFASRSVPDLSATYLSGDREGGPMSADRLRGAGGFLMCSATGGRGGIT
jgi:hypothetical protein